MLFRNFLPGDDYFKSSLKYFASWSQDKSVSIKTLLPNSQMHITETGTVEEHSEALNKGLGVIYQFTSCICLKGWLPFVHFLFWLIFHSDVVSVIVWNISCGRNVKFCLNIVTEIINTHILINTHIINHIYHDKDGEEYKCVKHEHLILK